MNTTIIPIPNGFAVQNSNGTFVGFAATLETAQGIKARADDACRIEIPGHGHIRIYSRHTDPMGRNWKYWLAFQPTGAEILHQVYFRKDNSWGPPQGQKLVREFSSYEKAYQKALTLSAS